MITRDPRGRPSSAAGSPGSLSRRLVARLADGVLVCLIGGLLSLGVLGDRYPYLVTGLFSGVLMFGYFVFCETGWGTTPGKRLVGLTVRGSGGSGRPDIRQSVIRNAFTLLAAVPYLGAVLAVLAVLAYWLIAVTINADDARQGLHDRLAGGTAVVRGRPCVSGPG